MKTISYKIFLIQYGLILLSAQSLRAQENTQFNNSINNELSNFSVHGLYVITGIIAAGLVFYFLSTRLNKEEKKLTQKTSITSQRRQHQRSVIKKTQ